MVLDNSLILSLYSSFDFLKKLPISPLWEHTLECRPASFQQLYISLPVTTAMIFNQWESSSYMRSQIPSYVVGGLDSPHHCLMVFVYSIAPNSTFNMTKQVYWGTQWIWVCVSWLSPWSLHLWTRGEVHEWYLSVVAEPNDPPAPVHDNKSCRCYHFAWGSPSTHVRIQYPSTRVRYARYVECTAMIYRPWITNLIINTKIAMGSTLLRCMSWTGWQILYIHILHLVYIHKEI